MDLTILWCKLLKTGIRKSGSLKDMRGISQTVDKENLSAVFLCSM